MNRPLLNSIWLVLIVTAAPGAGQGQMQAISGTLTVAPDLARHVAPDDRLIIKLYRPSGGVELDAKYQIVSSFELPLEFHAAPSIDMSGQTKFDAYVVEAFTDKNADVLAVAPGELIARTPEPVPLGTTDLRLELSAARE
jgi:hypothetical protein